jgi:hypothetical protein
MKATMYLGHRVIQHGLDQKGLGREELGKQLPSWERAFPVSDFVLEAVGGHWRL